MKVKVPGSEVIRAGKEKIRACEGAIVTSRGRSTIRTGQFFKPSHPLTNFEIQIYYQNKPKFKCVYSRNNSPRIKYRSDVINLGEYRSIETHWFCMLMVIGELCSWTHSKRNKKNIDNKNIITNIYRIQVAMCEYFCTWFINFMLLR